MKMVNLLEIVVYYLLIIIIQIIVIIIICITCRLNSLINRSLFSMAILIGLLKLMAIRLPLYRLWIYLPDALQCVPNFAQCLKELFALYAWSLLMPYCQPGLCLRLGKLYRSHHLHLIQVNMLSSQSLESQRCFRLRCLSLTSGGGAIIVRRVWAERGRTELSVLDIVLTSVAPRCQTHVALLRITHEGTKAPNYLIWRKRFTWYVSATRGVLIDNQNTLYCISWELIDRPLLLWVSVPT